MASSALPATANKVFASHSTPSGESSDRVRDALSFKNKVFGAKRAVTVPKVATRPPVSMPTPVTEGGDQNGKLAAWTSIQQEKWEGEMVVEGEIPLWLV